jgi:hypothetical protein
MLGRPGFLIPLSYPEEIDLKLKYYYSDWELEQELKRRALNGGETVKDELFKTIDEIKSYKCNSDCEHCELYIPFGNNYGLTPRKLCLRRYILDSF